jgi:exosortase A
MKRDLPLVSLPSGGDATIDARAWRSALATLAVSLGWIGAWYASTLIVMVRTWANSETFAHGFVVAPIALWLVWRLRRDVAALQPTPDWRALPLIALAGIVWLVAKLGAVNVLAQTALISMLIATVFAVLGAAVTRALLFPLGFLFFCVPAGEFLLPTLMEHTANFTVAALRLSGVPVYREGMLLVIPTGRWSIVEACSGVRYLIASLMVGTLFAYLNYKSLWRRWLFVGVSIVVPIVANWIRAYMIVMLGHLTNNRLAVGVDHIVYGWVFFGIVMLLMFWIGSKWREVPPPVESMTNSRAPATPVAAARPARFAGAAIALMAVTVVWPLAELRADAAPSGGPVNLALGPITGWAAAPAAAATPQLPAFEPRFALPSAKIHEQFERDRSDVGLFVAYYRDQRFDRKLVSSENRLVSSLDPVWNVVRTGSVAITIDGRQQTVPMTVLQTRDGKLLVALQWYWIDGSVTPSDAVAKALTAWSRLRGRGDDSAAIVVYARASTIASAQTELQTFVHDAWPSVATALVASRDRR